MHENKHVPSDWVLLPAGTMQEQGRKQTAYPQTGQ
jgi:hypothetical protein